ncbi:hypothetical protein Pla110_13140 [Polystyrenella longa]|uniref:Uncharacterized protein n=1 Tax=Polystyrenella longa TaxID=2528007 RepID=A0A518CK53_9PLAN|nr:DUF5658 family protein [Polystyrenella longa]QDU79603.1 hypothetical protein Pla110_13140 [Polystyrenella longa]
MTAERKSEPESEGKSPEEVSLWEFWTTLPIKLQRESVTFIIINLCDILMTWFLLAGRPMHSDHHTGNSFYESNPLAGYILNHWGIEGMVYFKSAMVGFVILVTQIIAQSKLPVARWILNFGSIIVLCVVCYSFWLYKQHAGPVDV